MFEDRYKEMVERHTRCFGFGIVLAREEGIVNAGCTVANRQVWNCIPMASWTHDPRQSRFDIVRLIEDKESFKAPRSTTSMTKTLTRSRRSSPEGALQYPHPEQTRRGAQP